MLSWKGLDFGGQFCSQLDGVWMPPMELRLPVTENTISGHSLKSFLELAFELRGAICHCQCAGHHPIYLWSQ